MTASYHGAMTTEPFRLSPAKYLRVAAGKLLPRVLTVLAVPVMACFVAACFDLRWAFVGLILLFLVAPTLIAYIYFYKLLTPEAREALQPKKITFEKECLTVEYLSVEENAPVPASRRISHKEITDRYFSAGCLVLQIKGTRYPLLIPEGMIPQGALECFS